MLFLHFTVVVFFFNFSLKYLTIKNAFKGYFYNSIVYIHPYENNNFRIFHKIYYLYTQRKNELPSVEIFDKYTLFGDFV